MFDDGQFLLSIAYFVYIRVIHRFHFLFSSNLLWRCIKIRKSFVDTISPRAHECNKKLCIWVGLVYDVCVHFISIKNVNEKTFYYLMLLQSMLPLDNEFHYISLYSLSKVLKRKWIMLLMYITFLCLLIWIVLLQQILHLCEY